MKYTQATTPITITVPSRRAALMTGFAFGSVPLFAHAGFLDSARSMLGQQPPRLLVGVLDVSASPSSTDIATLHQRALAALFHSALPGDVLLATTVGEAGMDTVQLKTVALPKTGKSFQDKRHVKDGVATAIAWLAEQPKNQRQSRYLETFASLQPAFMRALQGGVSVDMVVAGDAVENGIANFERTFEAPKLIAALTKKQLLLTVPDTVPSATPSARLSFVGAGGSDEPAYVRCRDFWRAYAKACRLELAWYGRDLPPFHGREG